MPERRGMRGRDAAARCPPSIVPVQLRERLGGRPLRASGGQLRGVVWDDAGVADFGGRREPADADAFFGGIWSEGERTEGEECCAAKLYSNVDENGSLRDIVDSQMERHDLDNNDGDGDLISDL